MSRRSPADNLTTASLTGVANRRSIQLTKQQCTMAEAVAELHKHSTDPLLLAQAIGSQDWAVVQRRALLIAAGCTEAQIDEAAAVIQERFNRGSGLGRLADNIQAAHKAARSPEQTT